MIKIKELSIMFNRLIIDNVDFDIYSNEITLLVGESGSGKSSLLNVLGLLDEKNKCHYYINDQLIMNNDYERLKREYIGYVFQEHNIIEDYNIMDNFKAMYNICGKQYNEKEVYELLNDVSLDYINLKLKAKSLSGGEKQRLAIALVLVKEPRLLLLDEPTASLDDENSQSIVNILHHLKKKGLMVVVSTHHPSIYNADHIYEIRDKKLIDIYHKKQVEMIQFEQKEKHKFNVLRHIYLNISNHLLLSLGIMLIFVFGIYNLLYMSVSLEHANTLLNEQLNIIADNIVFVSNGDSIMSDNDNQWFSNYNFPIEKEDIEYIKNIDNVKDVYPYYSISKIYAKSIINNNMVSFYNLDDSDIIKTMDTEVNMIEQFNDYLNVTSCMNEYQDVKCILLDENVKQGVYISSRLADALKITKLDHTMITFDCPIIMGNSTSVGSLIYEDGSVSAEFDTRPLEIVVKEMTFEIKGVYPVTAHQNTFFDIESGEKIYIDYRYMEELYNDIVSDKELYNQFLEVIKDNNGQDSQYYAGTDSSSIVVVCDNYEIVENTAHLIEEYKDVLRVKTKGNHSDLLKQMNMKNNSMMVIQPIIIYIVMMMLVTFVYIYILRQRRKDISFVYANGIHHSVYLPLYEILVLLLLSMPINVIIILVQLGICKYSLFVIIVHILAILFIGIVCILINKIYYNHFDPIKYLKSQR